ncbi:thiopurine S-methyltransferase [Shewanella sp. JM162201]|uniref:Thiopurine S-methyltransferase n=1 Tax=Shewanella jiangmenensis TaxID=2837387 RepID=A0ABS5V2Q8_9GAMM|nr:thiopurine S-methyltransferase [Shewanella jiangmenensis]MBT1444215.1 thiopurine S-methyltransferase [Shewanella jiangmenensis]
MEPGFWHDKWQSQQIGFHQADINPFLVRHWDALGLAPDARVFVPLCGKSRDMEFIAAKGHGVLGSELSALAVEQFFDEAGVTPKVSTQGEHRHYAAEGIELVQGDFFTIDPELVGSCKGFYDRAALIAWPAEMRIDYANKLAALIPSGSRGLLVTLDYPQEALSGPPFAVSADWVQTHLGRHFEVTALESLDVLADNPRFVKKAVPWLTEAAFLLVRK